jgi:hypothetical protein
MTGPGKSKRDLPGIRVLFNLDWRTILPLLILACWMLSLLQTVLWLRPDLLRPAQIVTDGSNYYAWTN